MSEPEDKNSAHKALGELLDRYISVWLWSILFGTSTGLLFTLSTLNPQRWGPLALAILFPALAATVFALLSWGYLYKAFTYHLLPQFVGGKHEITDPLRLAHNLKRAFALIILASMFRILASLIEVALSAGGRLQ